VDCHEYVNCKECLHVEIIFVAAEASCCCASKRADEHIHYFSACFCT